MITWFAILAMMVGVFMTGGSRTDDAGDMLPLLQRHEIQVLLSVGMAPAQIAARLGVCVDTVDRVGREPAVDHVDDAAEHRRRRIGRPSKTVTFVEAVQRWLREEADVPSQELLRRARGAGYTGAKSAFYGLVAANRRKAQTPVVRFEGLPGEFSQHDFGQLDVRFVDGRTKRIHFFASRLKYSRFVAVTIVPNEQVETLVRNLVRHFHSFGGVPLLAVFDRPRTIVTKGGRGREVEVFNANFAQVMLELGVGIEMCAPRSGNQKGAVEHLVKWVKNTFFKWRKFLDEPHLHSELADWVQEVNVRTKSRATGEFPETRRQQELPRLRPVRLLAESLALRVPIVVGPDAMVAFEGNRYTMPPTAAHVAGTAFVYEQRVRFVAGRHEVVHPRAKLTSGTYSLPEHRAQKVDAVRGRRARLYEMRQQLLDLGPAAHRLMTALIHRSPPDARKDIENLYAMLQAHGERRLRQTLDDAERRGTLGLSAVQAALDEGGPQRGRAEARPSSRSATARPEALPSARRARRAEPTGGRR